MIRQRLCILVGKTQRERAHLITSYQGHVLAVWLITMLPTPGPLAESSPLSRCPDPPPPVRCLWKEVTLHNPHFRICSYAPPLEGKALHKLLGVLLHGGCVHSPHLFIHSIIYLYQYGLLDIYFVLWVTIQYYFIYFVGYILPALATGRSSRGLFCPFDIWGCWVLPFERHRLILHLSSSSMEPWFLSVESDIRNQDLGASSSRFWNIALYLL